MNKQILKTFFLMGLSVSAASAFAASASKTIEFEVDATSDQIQVLNLAGQVRVIPSQTNKVLVRGEVIAEGSSQAKADELLEKIDFAFTEKGSKDIITVVYPVREYKHFVYNTNRKGWNSNSNTKYMKREVRVSTKPPSWGREYAQVHTNLVIELPSGQNALALVKLGAIEAENLDNSIALDTSSGRINISDSKGKLIADSGSGAIRVENFSGNVFADTGSGSVTLKDIDGDAEADTGSGSVAIDRVTGEVEVDTGSGSVKVVSFEGGEAIKVDTGSGSVRVTGDLSQVIDLNIDTGSGSVVLETTQPPSLDIEIDTGSGGISVDLPNLDVRRDKRGEFIGTAGSGAGEAVIDTGSGGVRFRMVDGYDFERSVTASKPVAKKRTDKNVAEQTTNNPKENVEVAKRLRAKLNSDPEIRRANLYITVEDDHAIIEGELDSFWAIARMIKMANEVEGVEGVKMNIDTED